MKPLIAHLINMTKANSVAGTLKSNADVIGGLHFSPTRPRLGGRLLYSESLQTQQNGWKNKRERKKRRELQIFWCLLKLACHLVALRVKTMFIVVEGDLLGRGASATMALWSITIPTKIRRALMPPTGILNWPCIKPSKSTLPGGDEKRSLLRQRECD